MAPNATTLQIPHGLVHQPKMVIANPALDVGDTWITNVDGRNFTFNCDTGVAAWCAIYWAVG